MLAAPTGLCRVEQIMGMPIVVDVRDEQAPGEALERVFDWLRTVDMRFSTYREDSEIRRLDRGELELADAHPHVRWILERCEELRVETGGYFDARHGGTLDPSGLVKGWAATCASPAVRCRTTSGGSGSSIPACRVRWRRSLRRATWRSRPRGRTRGATTSWIRIPAGRLPGSSRSR
jgi:thiamine biosynthesis lipoprotein ApbE